MFEKLFGDWVDVKKYPITAQVGFFQESKDGVAVFQKNTKTNKRRCAIKVDGLTSYKDADVVEVLLNVTVDWGE